jgi:hypothetical protein
MTGTDTVAGVVAAWYPDPAGSPLLRWWDGAAWTSHVREAVVAAPAPVAAPQVARVVAPVPPVAAPPSTASGYADLPAYVPMAGFGGAASSRGAVSTETSSLPTGSTLTTWVWLIAAFPFAQLVFALIVVFVVPDVPDGVLRYGFLGAAIAANLALARKDVQELEARGHRAPPVGWAVLPLGYLIIRTVRAGRLTLWPLFTWLAFYLVLVVLIVLAVLLPLFVASRVEDGAGPTIAQGDPAADAVPITADERAAQLTQGGMEQTLARDLSLGHEGVVDSVSCAPLASLAADTVALCRVAMTSGSLLELNAKVTPENPYTAFVVDGGRSLD